MAAIHGATWVRLIIEFLPIIINTVKDLLNLPDDQKNELFGKAKEIVTRVQEVTKIVEEVSIGGQKETWTRINQVIDSVPWDIDHTDA